MKINKLVLLRADNGSVSVQIPFSDLQQLVRKHTNWRESVKQPCLVARLFKLGTSEFNRLAKVIADDYEQNFKSSREKDCENDCEKT